MIGAEWKIILLMAVVLVSIWALAIIALANMGAF